MTWFDIIKRKRYGEDEVGRMGIGPETFFRKPKSKHTIGSYNTETREYTFTPTEDADEFADTLAEEITHEVQHIVSELDGAEAIIRQRANIDKQRITGILIRSTPFRRIAQVMNLTQPLDRDAREIIQLMINFYKKQLGVKMTVESHAKTHRFKDDEPLSPQIANVMLNYVSVTLMDLIDALVDKIIVRISPNYLKIFMEEFNRAMPEFVDVMISYVAHVAIKEIYKGEIKSNNEEAYNDAKSILLNSVTPLLGHLEEIISEHFGKRIRGLLDA
jgi:hypothetical protein